jgi:hypothetical protein
MILSAAVEEGFFVPGRILPHVYCRGTAVATSTTTSTATVAVTAATIPVATAVALEKRRRDRKAAAFMGLRRSTSQEKHAEHAEDVFALSLMLETFRICVQCRKDTNL